MLKVTIETMQGNAGGTKCLKVVRDNGTIYGETLGFVVPTQYNFEGYWGGISYFVCSFNHSEDKRTMESFDTLYEVAKHLGVNSEEFYNAIPKRENEPYYYQWEYMNTDFARDRW